MADNSAYREKNSLWKNVLYFAIIFCLIFMIVIMYGKWQKRKQQYKLLVEEASEQDRSVTIVPRNADDLMMDDEVGNY